MEKKVEKILGENRRNKIWEKYWGNMRKTWEKIWGEDVGKTMGKKQREIWGKKLGD